MVEKDQPSKDPVGVVNAAILKEQMENPDCPMAMLMEELLQKYHQGDSNALNFALKIAEETLAPKKPSVFEKIRIRIRNYLY